MRKISVSAHISLQYPHEDKAVQERQQKPKNQYIMEENTMLKINGYEVNYEHLFIYDGENILYKTERPYELNLEIEGLTVRNARKINFAKK